MSKVIYEFEKPKCCKECVWYQADAWFGGVCTISKKENGWSKDIGADEEYDVQKWCPLLPKTEVITVEWLRKWFLNNVINHGEMFDLLIADWEKENGKID